MAGRVFVERDEAGRKYRGLGGYQSGYQHRFAVRAMVVANLAANLRVPGPYRAVRVRDDRARRRARKCHLLLLYPLLQRPALQIGDTPEW
jgi:hypothetical protein